MKIIYIFACILEISDDLILDIDPKPSTSTATTITKPKTIIIDKENMNIKGPTRPTNNKNTLDDNLVAPVKTADITYTSASDNNKGNLV